MNCILIDGDLTRRRRGNLKTREPRACNRNQVDLQTWPLDAFHSVERHRKIKILWLKLRSNGGYIKSCVFAVVSLILIISSLVFDLRPRSASGPLSCQFVTTVVRMPPGVKIEGARGVDVEASVCRVVATGLDDRGVLTSRWGTGARTPRGRKRHKTAQSEKEMVPRFRTGRLAFDGRDLSLLPTPRKVR
jgi:hypothetical protein